MKRTLILLFALTVGIALCSPVQARGQESSRRMDRAVKTERVATREANPRIRQYVAENHARRLERRFAHYVERFEAIIARIETRLATLSGEGKDVADVQVKLHQAKSMLAQAKATGVQAVAAFKAIDPAKYEEQKDEILAARTLAEKAVKEFKDTFKLLRETIKLMKEVV